MKQIVISCESVTGNTTMLAEALRSHLQSANVKILPPEQIDANCYDLFFVGSWTDKGDCGAATAALLEQLHDKEVFFFGTCGFGGSEAYYNTVFHRFTAHLSSDNKIIGHYFCQGRMPESVLRRYEAMKNANPDCSRWDESIDNYNNALQHPNGRDLRELCAAIDAVITIE